MYVYMLKDIIYGSKRKRERDSMVGLSVQWKLF